MSNPNKLCKLTEPIRILKKIRTEVPDTIIAGGFFRDKFNDIPFRDIDIYVDDRNLNCSDHTDLEFWSELLKLKTHSFSSADDIEIDDSATEYLPDEKNSIVSVIKLIKNNLCYNIIMINKNPIDYVFSEFDFGICKVYCDGEKIKFSKEFMSDIENKTLTFTNKDISQGSFNHSFSVHLPKIQKKYPNYKLIVPESKQKLYTTYRKLYT